MQSAHGLHEGRGHATNHYNDALGKPQRLGQAALEALTNAKLHGTNGAQLPAALPLLGRAWDAPPTPQKTDALYLSVWAPFANGGQPVDGRHFMDALQLVATCHRRHGRLDFAEAGFLRVLEKKQQICAERPEPPSHCELADTLNDLGLVHLKQGKARLQDAEAAFRHALAIRTDPRMTAFQRQYHGPHPLPPDPDVAIAYNNLALCHLKQRRLFEAEAGFRAALELQRSQGELNLAEPLELGHLTHNLATVHQLQGQLQLARDGFQLSALCLDAHRARVAQEGAESLGTKAEDARIVRSDAGDLEALD